MKSKPKHWLVGEKLKASFAISWRCIFGNILDPSSQDQKQLLKFKASDLDELQRAFREQGILGCGVLTGGTQETAGTGERPFAK